MYLFHSSYDSTKIVSIRLGVHHCLLRKKKCSSTSAGCKLANASILLHITGTKISILWVLKQYEPRQPLTARLKLCWELCSTGVKTGARTILPWSEQIPQYLLTLVKQNRVPCQQRISIHSGPFFSLPPDMGAKKTKASRWQHASWHVENSPSVQIALPIGWEKMEEFTDWMFVAGMFSFPLPGFGWLDQSTNRRKGAHAAWPCHPKWLWHFQERSPCSRSLFLAAFALSHKRFLQQ